MIAHTLFDRLKLTYSHYNHFYMLGDYRVRCELCSKIVAFRDKQSLDRHLNTSFHCTFASITPQMQKLSNEITSFRSAISRPHEFPDKQTVISCVSDAETNASKQ
jgi:uncharacterized C2H2 Zn-finger protein